MFAVMKKELKSYLLSPTGYVFIGIFLLLFSVFFYISIFSYQSLNFENLFYNGATILTFVAPVLTMGMFSAERKSGTEQLLLTAPRSLTAIVFGGNRGFDICLFCNFRIFWRSIVKSGN